MLIEYYVDAAYRLEEFPEILRHSVRVSGLAHKLAKKMGCKDPDSYALAGIMHDLGKSKWPSGLHDKKGLSADEWKIIHEHPIRSAEIAKDIWPNISSILLEMIVNHHERPNGRGTPNGIKNTALPVLILAVADVFDALTRPRPYRGTIFSPEQATEEVTRWAPLSIVSALSDITGVHLKQAVSSNSRIISTDAKVDTVLVSSIPLEPLPKNACSYLKLAQIDNQKVYTCNRESSLDQVYLSRFCLSKWSECADYIRFIAIDLQKQFSRIGFI